MNDNPFSEPEDNEKTVVRLPTGGRAPTQGPTGAGAGGGMPSGAGGPGGGAASLPPSAAAGATLAPPAPRLAGEAEALPKVGRSPMVAAAAPLLDLLARIGAAPSAVAKGEELRDRAMRALQVFEADCRAAQITDEQLRAGHYALCAALDDTAMATPWGQASGWAARSLSSTFHQDVRSGDRFFDLLAGLQKDPGRYLPALEICYLCLALGLRGRYRLDPRGSAELDRIREGLYQLLQRVNGGFERELSPNWRGVDAPHTGPGRRIPAWVAPAVAVSLLALGWVWASTVINSRGDDQAQRLAQLPPGQPPVLERSGPVVAPAAVAPVAGDVVARFREFLAPEMAEGLVVVEGDAQRLLIRVLSRGMFDSGSADLEPRFVALLQRIGEGLRTERGRVAVVGHSDNIPIRTVRFPSNFQLSAARAESARVVLARSAGDDERFKSVGRADTEPLAPNTTAAGREANRRIEIVLTRGEGR
jgi:type VI secretion system protein ImpK